MKTTTKYKIFLHDKSLDELQFNSSLWISELKFIDVELAFIKHLIKTYPIKSKIPNSIERLQLFIQELDSFEKKRNIIIDEIHQYTNQLKTMIECDKLSCDNLYVIAYEKLAKKVFNYLRTYRNLKIKIYEYVNSILG